MSDEFPSMDAAEYVLGTLSAAERATFESAMQADPALRETVDQWENWLAGLNDVIPEAVPADAVWPAIAAALASGRAPNSPPTPLQDNGDLAARLRRSRARWRAATVAFAAIAAALALFVASTTLRQPPSAASYLAVVNRGGDLPALIVHVDTATDQVTVRSVAAETPAGRSLQLWYIGTGQTPRSLGLLNQPQTRAALPPAARAGDIAGATLAVSVEPVGGSPTGQPTGPVVYSGKLIRE